MLQKLGSRGDAEICCVNGNDCNTPELYDRLTYTEPPTRGVCVCVCVPVRVHVCVCVRIICACVYAIINMSLFLSRLPAATEATDSPPPAYAIAIITVLSFIVILILSIIALVLCVHYLVCPMRSRSSTSGEARDDITHSVH